MIGKPGQHVDHRRLGIDPHSFRTPVPVERFRLIHPNVPEAAEGLTILHVTDTHVRRYRDRYRALCEILRRIRVDLVLLTGDYMTHPGDEEVAMRVFEEMVGCWQARLGAYGVFGNHDSPPFQRAVREIGGVTWLDPGVIDLPDAPVRLLGTSWPEDWTELAMRESEVGDAGKRIRIALVHTPAALPGASRLGVDIMVAGHTHGGQIRWRLPGFFSWAPHTSTDLFRHHPSGILRLRDTLCCISRGLGEQIVEMRVQCPTQLPIYTLARGPAPGRNSECITRPLDW